MPNRASAIAVLVIFVIGMLAIPGAIRLAHAATGKICLADPSTASATAPCPTSAPLFDGPASTSSVSNQLRVGLFIQGSDPLNGFAVIMKADHTILKPAGVDLSGTVVPGPTTIIVECLSNVLVVGSACNPSADNIDTLDFAIAATPGGITGSGTTGLLFTAIYNITGTSASSGIIIGFQTDSTCSPSSIIGTPPVCVILGNGSGTPDSETAQAATFNNSNAGTMPFAAVSASPSSFGPSFPGANSATVTATQMNGFPGLATGLVTFTTTATTGLSASLLASSCTITVTSCSASLSLTTSPAGNYFVIVSGSYATFDPAGNPDTLVGVVRINVVVDDFGFTVSPTVITSGSATVTLTSLNGFAGGVTLSQGVAIPTTPPLTMTFNPNPVTLAAGQTLTSIVTFSASVTTATTYHATIKATSGTRVKTSPVLTITVSPVTVDPTSTSVGPVSCNIVLGATSCSSSITATVTDATTASNVPTGTVTFTLTAGTTGGSLGATTCTLSTGSCSVTFTGTMAGSGSISASYGGDTTHSTSTSTVASVTVTVSPKDSTTTSVPNVNCNVALGATSCTASVTATVMDTTTASNVPTGTVTFTLTPGATGGGLSSMTCALSAGSCSVTFTGTTAGAGSVTASYGGDPTHNTSASAAATITVTATSKDSTSTAVPNVSCNIASVATNCISSITATVTDTTTSSSAPTGTVTFALTTGTTGGSLGATSCTLSFGNCSVTFTGTMAGSASVTASYVGDSTHSASTSPIATITVTKPIVGFNLTLKNASQNFTVIQGSSTDSLNVTGIGGFNGTITFAETVTFGGIASTSLKSSCTSVTISKTSPSALSTCSFTSSTAGAYSVLVTGTNSSSPISQSTVYSVTVSKLSPTISTTLSSASIPVGSSVTDSAKLAGATSTAGGTVAYEFFTGSSCSGAPTPVGTPVSVLNGIIPNSTSLVFNAGGYFSWNALYNGDVNNTAAKSNCTILSVLDFSLAASPSSLRVARFSTDVSTLTATSIGGFAGTVTLSASVVGGTLGITPTLTSLSISSGGSSTLTVTVDKTVNPGNYTVNVMATSGSITHIVSIMINVPFPGLTLSASPQQLTVVKGTSATSTISVTGIDGFNGTAIISANWLPKIYQYYPVYSFSQPSVTLGVNGHGSFVLNMTIPRNVAAGAYRLNVNMTGGGVQEFIQVFVIIPIPDFSVTPTLTSVTVTVGYSGSSNFAFAPLNGFADTVSLTFHTSSGLQCSLSSSSVILGSSGSATLSCSSSTAGVYQVNITATGDVDTHVKNIVFTVQDFLIDVPATSVVANTGQSTSPIPVTISDVGGLGFAGTVTLALTADPGLNAHLNVTSVDVPGTAGLTLSSNAPGTYHVTVTASNGTLSHSERLTVNVYAPSEAAGLPAGDVYVAVGVVGVLAVLGLFLGLRRRSATRRSKNNR